MLDKPLYTKAELLEAIRQVLFTGDPELYERGGIHGGMPSTNTRKRAEEAFNKYAFKINQPNDTNTYSNGQGTICNSLPHDS